MRIENWQAGCSDWGDPIGDALKNAALGVRRKYCAPTDIELLTARALVKFTNDVAVMEPEVCEGLGENGARIYANTKGENYREILSHKTEHIILEGALGLFDISDWGLNIHMRHLGWSVELQGRIRALYYSTRATMKDANKGARGVLSSLENVSAEALRTQAAQELGENSPLSLDDMVSLMEPAAKKVIVDGY